LSGLTINQAQKKLFLRAYHKRAEKQLLFDSQVRQDSPGEGLSKG